jgi:hypothetical protein
VLHQNSKSVIVTTRGENGVVQMKFRRDGTFLSKPKISEALEGIKDDSTLEIVATGEFLDHDVKELLTTFISGAHARRITVRLVGVDLAGATVGGGH